MKLVFLLSLYAILALEEFVKAGSVAEKSPDDGTALESKKLPDTNVSADNENVKNETAVSLTLKQPFKNITTSLAPITTEFSDEELFDVPYNDSLPYNNEIPYHSLTVDVPSPKEYQPELSKRTTARQKLSENEILSKDIPNSISSSKQENRESNIKTHSFESTLDSKISPAGEMPPNNTSQINETFTGSTLLPLNKLIPNRVSSPSDEQKKKDDSDKSEEKEGKQRNATSSSHQNLTVNHLYSTQKNPNQMNYNVSKNKPASSVLGCNRISYIVNTNRSNTWKAIPEARVPPYSKFGYSLIKSRQLDLDLEQESEIECPAVGCQLPHSYDSRSSYPICTTLQQPLDQGCNCKASWAVSTASAFSDRLCISTGGQITPELSAQDVLSCAGGCDGGYSVDAWKYFKEQGVVTGSQYGQGRGCQPYLIKPCMTEYQISTPVVEPGCNKDCQSSNDPGRKIIRYKVARSYSLNNASIFAIKKEIFFRGPVTADVTVYEDFQCYMSGIYNHVVGESLGYKSVKIIGWGVENGIDYWLAANTWGSLWGEKGFFKVQMEADDHNMELHISAGIPLIRK